MIFDIVEISLIEQVSKVSFVCQRDAKNLQDFIGRAFQVHIMLDNSHETVSDNGHTDLYADSILRRTPKSLYL